MNLKQLAAVFLLVFVPFFCFAQELDSTLIKLEKQTQEIKRLENKTAVIDKIVKKLDKLKVTAYIQTEFQHGQKDATLKVGDKNENMDKSFNRIGVRRGRLKFEYIDGIGRAAVQIEVNDKGVSFRDLYIGVKDPWIGRNSLMVGVFNRPFGYEVGYSTSNLESPERATIIQYFFPDERDLGAMLTLQTKKESTLHFLKLEAGLFAGNSINKETDNRKDFIGRLSATKEIGSWGKWGLGASYYNGSVYNPTNESYQMKSGSFIKKTEETVGTFMKREYFGLDAQFTAKSSWGKTTVRAEWLSGVQPGIASSSKSPNSSNRPTDKPENALYARNFNGYFFYLIHDILSSPFSALVKYDVYDPNTEVEGDEVGRTHSLTSKTDLYQSTLAVGALWRINKNLRAQAYYEFKANEKSIHVDGYTANREDDMFTLRLQYKF